ncbi:MAG TPA: tRNA (N6-threonylcarbamoyladenosine(37)-N6)-methyltransferase TrmO [Terriglobales bacterium]|nr:tRNA (N6-threonylcarbamoyladenosine(37)-N6)-methyltransferase TrmO [Terriglobales bacterium]
MTESTFLLKPIGVVRSALADRKNAPRQGSEGAPEAWIEILPEFHPGLEGVEAGAEVLLLTWLHLGRRETMKVHPRGTGPLTGVFATRSPDRPNPIGIHPATVLEVDGGRIRLSGLEAVDGTPVVDIKPVIC